MLFDLSTPLSFCVFHLIWFLCLQVHLVWWWATLLTLLRCSWIGNTQTHAHYPHSSVTWSWKPSLLFQTIAGEHSNPNHVQRNMALCSVHIQKRGGKCLKCHLQSITSDFSLLSDYCPILLETVWAVFSQVYGFYKGMTMPVIAVSLSFSLAFGTSRNVLQYLCKLRHGSPDARPDTSDIFLSGLAGGIAQVNVFSF